MTFPSKKKILKLCFKGYIFRSYQFLAEEPFNLLTADFFFLGGGGGGGGGGYTLIFSDDFR